MILATFVSTDDLVKEGKNYNWKRPCKCQNPAVKVRSSGAMAM